MSRLKRQTLELPPDLVLNSMEWQRHGKGSMDNRMQVKQYVAVVKGNRSRFMVFQTGDPKYYLFSQLFPNTLTATGLHIPVLKKDLQPDIKRALAHGWGNSL